MKRKCNRNKTKNYEKTNIYFDDDFMLNIFSMQ